MSVSKKISVFFLSLLSVLNLAAAAAVDVTVIAKRNVFSVLPIKVPLSAIQALSLNFFCFAAIIVLINVVLAYLVTDIPYSPKEILLNCPGIFMVLPVIILAVGIYAAVACSHGADALCIIASQAFFVLASAVGFGCIITIKDD